jgi:hypothetical protein
LDDVVARQFYPTKAHGEDFGDIRRTEDGKATSKETSEKISDKYLRLQFVRELQSAEFLATKP